MSEILEIDTDNYAVQKLKSTGGGSATLQSKSVTITTNTTTDITPDEGYDGLSSVAVTTNVQSSNNAKIETNIISGVMWVQRLIKEIPGTLTIPNESTLNSATEAFRYCGNLISAPSINNFDKVTNVQRMFQGCSNLQNVPVYDTSKVSGFNVHQYWFVGCDALTNESLNNILLMCINSKITSNKTLAYIGLSQEQATTCTTLSNWSALSALGWSTGY